MIYALLLPGCVETAGQPPIPEQHCPSNALYFDSEKSTQIFHCSPCLVHQCQWWDFHFVHTTQRHLPRPYEFEFLCFRVNWLWFCSSLHWFPCESFWATGLALASMPEAGFLGIKMGVEVVSWIQWFCFPSYCRPWHSELYNSGSGQILWYWNSV